MNPLNITLESLTEPQTDCAVGAADWPTRRVSDLQIHEAAAASLLRIRVVPRKSFSPRQFRDSLLIHPFSIVKKVNQ